MLMRRSSCASPARVVQERNRRHDPSITVCVRVRYRGVRPAYICRAGCCGGQVGDCCMILVGFAVGWAFLVCFYFLLQFYA